MMEEHDVIKTLMLQIISIFLKLLYNVFFCVLIYDLWNLYVVLCVNFFFMCLNNV